MSACLAMLAGIPVDQAVLLFHATIWDDGKPLHWCLEELGIQHRPVFYEGHTCYAGKVYLVTVASLNTRGGLHQIIIDCRGEKTVVFDPAQGFENKFYYAWEPTKGDDEWAVPLESWLIEYEVVPHD